MALAPLLAQAADKARLAVVGEFDSVNIGQAGYCGERVEVPRSAWNGIFVDGGEPVFFRMKSTIRTPLVTHHCDADYAFLPQAGNAYIVRYSWVEPGCLFELFRVVPGADPVRENLTRPEPKSCLVK